MSKAKTGIGVTPFLKAMTKLYAIEREATPAIGGVVSAFDMVGFTASAQCGDQLKIESVLIEKR